MTIIFVIARRKCFRGFCFLVPYSKKPELLTHELMEKIQFFSTEVALNRLEMEQK